MMGKAKNDPPPAMPGSDARQRGRKLILTFDGDELPVLARIEFKVRQELEAGFLEKDHPVRGSGFEWEAVAQALSLLFLKYLIWDKNGFFGRCVLQGQSVSGIVFRADRAAETPKIDVEHFSRRQSRREVAKKNASAYFRQRVFFAAGLR
jgi:hypothetical protein